MTNLIARFVFDKGSTADIELPTDEREALLKAFNERQVYNYKDGISVFWCDMERLSFFYIIPKQEVSASPGEIKQ